MGLFTLFFFTLLAVSSILPGGLALPRRCPTNNSTNAGPPSDSYSLPPGPTLSPSPIQFVPESTSTPLPSTSSTPLPSTSSTPVGGSTPSSDIQTFLDSHNDFRANHGASPLTWSGDLASKAQEWAGGCQFEHSNGNFGENLAAGSGTSYEITDAVRAWTDEINEYDPANPTYSHFTQVVWKSTKELGCVRHICNNLNGVSFGDAPSTFIVCEYFPPGNVIGQFAENVQK